MFMTKTVLGNLFSKYSTRLHPVEQRSLPEIYRGRFEFTPEKCILCKLCSLKCPSKVIAIDTETGVWEQDVKGCIYCGVCEDVCPTKCLSLVNEYRQPFTESKPVLTFTAPPRPKKSKTAAKDAAAPAVSEEAVAPAVETGKAVAVEEESTQPQSAAAPQEHKNKYKGKKR